MAANYDSGKQNSYYITKYVTPCFLKARHLFYSSYLVCLMVKSDDRPNTTTTSRCFITLTLIKLNSREYFSFLNEWRSERERLL